MTVTENIETGESPTEEVPSNRIKLSGNSLARGRNGWFVPRSIEVTTDEEGRAVLKIFSRQRGDAPPIVIALSREDQWTFAGKRD